MIARLSLLQRPFLYDPPPDALHVVHEDADLLVVNKPSGLLSVPGKAPELSDCLASRVESAYPGAMPVHRLDMETSGLVLFARTKQALRHLGWQFEKRRVEKRYAARVDGRVRESTGEIDLPLRCDWPNRPRQMVCFERGKPSQTAWQVIELEAAATRMALFPKTGRSHQLRVHLATIGHPILGDPLYAPDDAFAAAERLQLHAEHLRLRHPDGGAWVDFEATCPF